MKIKIKYHNKNCKLQRFGNWIDLRSAVNIEIKKFESKLIPLGVSMKLPHYFQANIVPRSGTFKNFGIIQANHYGVVDGPTDENEGYSGNNDVWMYNAIALRDAFVAEGDRICQFEIKPAMSAPWYIKLRWLFTNKIEFVEVDDLETDDRGGFGSTGVK